MPPKLLNDRVRERLAEEKLKRGLTERGLADSLGWSQSQVSYKLSGRTELSVNDLEHVCSILRLRLVAVVRDPNLELCDEMTPAELRFFKRFREVSKPLHDLIVKCVEENAENLRLNGTPERRRSRSPKQNAPETS